MSSTVEVENGKCSLKFTLRPQFTILRMAGHTRSWQQSAAPRLCKGGVKDWDLPRILSVPEVEAHGLMEYLFAT